MVLAHYEDQSEKNAAAEDEAGIKASETVMRVPRDLVPIVRKTDCEAEAVRSEFDTAAGSISGLTPVANGQNNNLFTVEAIQSDVSTLSEFNHPLAKFRRQLFHRPAGFRVLAKCFHAFADLLDGASRGIWALRS